MITSSHVLKGHRLRLRGSLVVTCGALALVLSSGTAGASVWTVQNSQYPPNASYSELSSVSCNGATRCMAVGYWFGTTPAKSKTLAESWNGTRYEIVHTPNPTASGDQLYGISCSSVDKCFAVGEALADTHPIIEQWTNSQWRLVDSGGGGTSLNGVSCVNASFCIAVGVAGLDKSGLVDGWNGSVWTVESKIRPTGYSDAELSGVSCSSSISCTAVGSATDAKNDPHLLTVTWNGSVWTPNVLAYPASANQGGLVSISCPAAKGCMAVGWTNGTTGDGAVAEQSNGSTWTPESLPSGESESAVAESVSCTSTTACEAVGALVHTWADSWSGRSWTVDQTVEQPGVVFLYGASCTTSGGCAAVGMWDPGGTSSYRRGTHLVGASRSQSSQPVA